MGDLYAILDNGEFFWLRCDGPDGLVWLMARNHNICGQHFLDLPQDAREMQPIEERDGAVWVHKWRIVQVHACRPPRRLVELDDVLWEQEVPRG